MADTKIAWAPWEEREVPGFGRVFFGLAMAKEKGLPPTIPT